MNSKNNHYVLPWIHIIETVMVALGFIGILIHDSDCKWIFILLLSFSSLINIWIQKKNKIIDNSLIWQIIQILQIIVFLFLNLYFHELSVYSVVSILMEYVLFCATMLCYYGVSTKNWKPETIYLVIAIPYGVFFSLSLPVKSAPDEISHIYTAYRMADQILKNDDVDNKTFLVREEDQIFLSAPVEYGNNEELMNDIYKAAVAESYGSVVKQDRAVCLEENKVAYVVSAIGIAIGKFFNWNAFWTLNFGRIMNLLQYIFLIYLSIKIIPFSKYVPVTVALLPVAVQQGMSYSYDSLVIGLSVFIVCGSYSLKQYCLSDKKEKYVYGCIVLITGLVLASLKNHSYIFVAIIPLIVLFSENKVFHKILIWLLKLMIAGILLFTVYTIMDTIFNFKPFFVEPSNPIAWQDGVQGYTIQYFLNDPKSLLVVYLRTFIVYSKFYVCSATSDYMSWLTIRTPMIFIPLFLFLCFLATKGENQENVNKTEKICFLMIALITISAIIMGLLIAWTPIDTGVALGVQGRYFIPLFVPIFMIFTTKCNRNCSYVNYIPVVYALALMLFSVCLITRF